MALLVASCGLRISEALGLHWRDILWDRGLIAIRQTWVHMKMQDGAKTKLSRSRVETPQTAARYACCLAERPVKRFGFHVLGRHSLATFPMEEGENPAVVQAIMRHAKLDMTLYYSHSRRKQKLAAQREGAATIATSTGARTGAAVDSMTMTTDLKVACYDDFAAKQWALNSAVECHPHTVEVVGSNPTAPTTRLRI